MNENIKNFKQKIDPLIKRFKDKIFHDSEITKNITISGYKPFKSNNGNYDNKQKLFIVLYYLLIFTWGFSLFCYLFLSIIKGIILFILNFIGMFSGFNMEFFKKPDPIGNIIKNIYNFVAYLLCIPFTSETKKFGTLNRLNNINNNNSRNKNLEKKCGGWWLVWGSIMIGYLLISLAIGPGALIGLVIFIPSLHFFSLQLNKSIEDFNLLKKKEYIQNNSYSNENNNYKITKNTLIKNTPLKKMINRFILLVICNIIITLILAVAV